MQLNGPHTEHEHASVSLKVLLLIFGLVLVAALGWFVWDNNMTADTTDNTAPSVKKEATTETATTADETADWKTFTTTYGYSFKYPETVAPESKDDGTGSIQLSDPGGGPWEYSVQVSKNTDNLSLTAALNKQPEAANKDATITTITVGGKSAKQYVVAPATDSIGAYGVVLLNGSDIMIILSRGGGKEFSNLLSTFKFTK